MPQASVVDVGPKMETAKLDDDGKREGTQAIRRAAAILKSIARGPKNGMTLRDVSEAMELSRSTAHRILKCLLDERVIDYSESSRRYVIGDLTFELGLAATSHQREIVQWRPTIDAIAGTTGATVYLMGRSGNESVCLCKAEGSSVVRVIPVEVGQRRPLGVGAGATALLAAASDEDCESVLSAIASSLDAYPRLTVAQIRRNIEAARQMGFAESCGSVVEGVYGLGVAIPAIRGPATLAVSLAAHESLTNADTTSAWKRQVAKLLKAATANGSP
jgi:DNA-binding IclR family transcriptional regulator